MKPKVAISPGRTPTGNSLIEEANTVANAGGSCATPSMPECCLYIARCMNLLEAGLRFPSNTSPFMSMQTKLSNVASALLKPVGVTSTVPSGARALMFPSVPATGVGPPFYGGTRRSQFSVQYLARLLDSHPWQNASCLTARAVNLNSRLEGKHQIGNTSRAAGCFRFMLLCNRRSSCRP